MACQKINVVMPHMHRPTDRWVYSNFLRTLPRRCISSSMRVNLNRDAALPLHRGEIVRYAYASFFFFFFLFDLLFSSLSFFLSPSSSLSLSLSLSLFLYTENLCQTCLTWSDRRRYFFSPRIVFHFLSPRIRRLETLYETNMRFGITRKCHVIFLRSPFNDRAHYCHCVPFVIRDK